MKPIIKVENLSKQYRLGASQASYATLRESITDALRAPLARFRRNGASSRYPSFWSLKDVSFDIAQGEVVGIIGRNGAGKSTLLKILSRIAEPTHGEIEIYGRIASLLEVGTGFHPELTGRENIFLNGSILGMKRQEIERKFDEIVAFAEVEQFVDTPVKHYSSGMYLRLAFAVAAHLEPEILLVDEVLAVGDMAFQKKCLGKMSDVARQGRTVLFVSHNMAAVRSLCSRTLVLQQGKIICDDNVECGIAAYIESGSDAVCGEWQRPPSNPASALAIERVVVALEGEQPNLNLIVRVELTSRSNHKPAFIALDIHDRAGTTIMQALPTVDGFIEDGQTHHDLRLNVNLPPFIPGSYLLTVWVGTHNTETLDTARECVTFEVLTSPTLNRTFPHTADHGYIVPTTKVEYATW